MRYLIVFTLLLTSCGGGGNGGTDNNITSPPPTPPVLNEVCIDYAERIKRCSFEWDNIQRTYYLKIPLQASNNNNLPLLISMHGYGGNALSHINYTNFKNIADREVFILSIPKAQTYHPI